MKNFLIKNMDKLYHLIANFAIVCIISYISVFAAVIIALLASIAKEVYDYFYKTNGKFSPADLIIDVVGIMLAGAYLTIVGYIN